MFSLKFKLIKQNLKYNFSVKLTTVQVLNIHVWLLTTTLESKDGEHFHPAVGSTGWSCLQSEENWNRPHTQPIIESGRQGSSILSTLLSLKLSLSRLGNYPFIKNYYYKKLHYKKLSARGLASRTYLLSFTLSFSFFSNMTI